MAKYKFEAAVKKVQKLQPEAGDTGPFLRVTLDNGHRVKVPLDGSENKKVVAVLRKGVIVEGNFDGIHGWTPDGQAFAAINSLINADITAVRKGSYQDAEIEDGIDAINWDDVQATVQKAFVVPGTEKEAGATPDMAALAASLLEKPQS
jgi:hypothetical protein